MKIEWTQLEVMLLERRAELITALCRQEDMDDTQWLRGEIAAINWVIDTPSRIREEAEFESQREKMNGY